MENKNNLSGGGIGIGTILFIVFLILKLTGAISWSWVWVCAPLWIPIALIVVGLLIIVIFGLIVRI